MISDEDFQELCDALSSLRVIWLKERSASSSAARQDSCRHPARRKPAYTARDGCSVLRVECQSYTPKVGWPRTTRHVGYEERLFQRGGPADDEWMRDFRKATDERRRVTAEFIRRLPEICAPYTCPTYPLPTGLEGLSVPQIARGPDRRFTRAHSMNGRAKHNSRPNRDNGAAGCLEELAAVNFASAVAMSSDECRCYRTYAPDGRLLHGLYTSPRRDRVSYFSRAAYDSYRSASTHEPGRPGGTAFLSRRDRNRLQHALNGNTSAAVLTSRARPSDSRCFTMSSSRLERQPVHAETNPTRCVLSGSYSQLGLWNCCGRNGTGSQERFARVQRKPLGQKVKTWYSRLKLWDEAQVLGKRPEDLTDEEFDRALWNIHRYFAMHPAYVHNWELQRDKGPQSVADRHNVERLNYLGHPRRFIYYSGHFFSHRSCRQFAGATIEDVTEGEFMEALKRTSARAANHAVVRNYLVAHSGPQCFIQRFDQALMALEPRAPHTAAVRPKAFEWIECSRCKKTATGGCGDMERLFANRTWLRETDALERRRLHSDYPRLSGLLTEWFLHGVPTDRVVKLRHVEKVLKSNGLSSVWEDGGYRIALLDCVSDLAVQHVCRCEEIQEMIVDLWNKRDGQAFDCVMLVRLQL